MRILLLLVCAFVVHSEAQEYCSDTTYNGTSGLIQSPNFPESYQPNSRCVYDIVASSISRISLAIKSLDLEVQENCNFDWIEVQCVSHDIGPPVRYCGYYNVITNNLTIYFSPCTDVKLTFVSDTSVNGHGFSVSYVINKIDCVGNCTPVSNEFGYACPCDTNASLPTSSPDPDCESFGCLLSTNGRYCYCNRLSPTTLWPSTTSNTPRSQPNCGYGCYRTTDWLGYPICSCPASTSSPLSCSYGCYSRYDFWGNQYCDCSASTQPSIWCSSGCTRTTNIYGSQYCRCPTTTITPCFYPCFYQWNYTYSYSGERYCYCPPTTTPPPPTGCNQTLTASTGAVTSPNYPNAYPKGIDCYQKINVPMASSIRFQMIDLNIKYSDSYNCFYEYVEIFGCDGNYYVYCSSYSFPYSGLVIQCTDNTLTTINFHSDANNYYYSYRGFKFTYSANFGTNCSSDGGIFLSQRPTGVLTSPNYPNNFPVFAECFSYLFADDSINIKITFEQLRLDASSSCENVFLKFTCQDTNMVETVCGSKFPAPMTFDCSALQVWFRSNLTTPIDNRKYSIRYVAVPKPTRTPSLPTGNQGNQGNQGDTDLTQSARLGIGLGVGIGGFFLIILIVIILVLIVMGRRQTANREELRLQDIAIICRNLNARRGEDKEGFENPLHS